MTRLPKKRGITQVEEDKSLILRQKSDDSPKVITDENRVQKWMIFAPLMILLFNYVLANELS